MPWGRASGLTLVELMVSLVVGLVAMLAAMSLLLSVQRSHDLQDDLMRIDEHGRYATDVLTRMVRQAGYYENDPAAHAESALPAVLGIDAARVPRNSEWIESAQPSEVNGSDVLAIKHQASGPSAVLNCAGFKDAAAAAPRSSWSIFYVARDAAGEPQLYCKYEGETGWNADAVVSGVESFQVLYGIDGDGDGLPERWLNATAIGSVHTVWNQVVMIRIALLLRGPARQVSIRGDGVLDLFGSDYSEIHGAGDVGVRLLESELRRLDGSRVRKVIQASVYLRGASRKRAP